jgi:pyruvate/2-oxoglutarate dehydrogenase complex dihydrolipoamide acyltransferase (E2) component
MLLDLLMPDLDLRRGSPRVGQWLVDVGAAVLEGDGVLEISADGVTVEVPSPSEGTLHATFVGEDDPLTPGQRLAQIAITDPT